MSSLDFTVPLDSPIEGMTADFVVRSLRRRLWRAFQEDDSEKALRAYQATFVDFQEWLEEEVNMRIEDEVKSNAKSPRVSRHCSILVANASLSILIQLESASSATTQKRVEGK